MRFTEKLEKYNKEYPIYTRDKNTCFEKRKQ